MQSDSPRKPAAYGNATVSNFEKNGRALAGHDVALTVTAQMDDR